MLSHAAGGAILGGMAGALLEALGEPEVRGDQREQVVADVSDGIPTRAEAEAAEAVEATAVEAAAAAEAELRDAMAQMLASRPTRATHAAVHAARGSRDADEGEEARAGGVHGAMEQLLLSVFEDVNGHGGGSLQELQGLFSSDGQQQPAADGDISRLPTRKWQAPRRALPAEEVPKDGAEGLGGWHEADAPACASCAVCLEEYRSGDELTTLPCFHSFHSVCCRQWLQQSGTCPVCKHRVDDAGDEGLLPTDD